MILVQAQYDMTSHKLQQNFFQLVYSHKYVLYNISKVLRNPRGGKLLKLRKSVMAFSPAVTHVEKVIFAYMLV